MGIMRHPTGHDHMNGRYTVCNVGGVSGQEEKDYTKLLNTRVLRHMDNRRLTK